MYLSELNKKSSEYINIMNKKCVLIGYLGYGKTTLFNKICDKLDKQQMKD